MCIALAQVTCVRHLTWELALLLDPGLVTCKVGIVLSSRASADVAVTLRGTGLTPCNLQFLMILNVISTHLTAQFRPSHYRLCPFVPHEPPS